MKTKSNTVTDLNLHVMARYFTGAEVIANKVEPVSANHIRRCLKAGLIAVTDSGKTLTMTESGRAALGRTVRF